MQISKLSNGQFLKHIPQWIFLIGILVTSLAFSNKIIDPTHLPRYLTTSVFLFLTLILIVLSKKEKKIKIDLILILYFIYVFFELISSFWANTKSESYYDSSKVLLGFIVFLIVIYFNNNIENFLKYLSILSIAIILIGFIIFIFQTRRIEHINKDVLYEVSGISGSKNLFSSFLFLLIPFAIYGAILHKKSLRYVSIFAATISLGIIIFLQSRAVWIGFVATVFTAILLLITFLRKKSKSLKYFSYFLIPILLIGFIVTIYYLRGDINSFISRINIFDYNNTASSRNRLFLWDRTFCFYKSHFWFGVGAGNWQVFFQSCPLGGFYVGDMHNNTIQRPHNDFIWVLSEIGIFGFLAYLSFHILLITKSIKTVFRSNANNEPFQNIVFISFLIGFMAISFFTFPRERLEHIIYSNLLLGTIFYKIKRTSRETIIFPEYKIKQIFLIIPIILIFSIIFKISHDRIRGEFHMRNYYYYKRKLEWKNAEERSKLALSKFYTLDPFSIPINWYLGTAQVNQNNIDDAFENFKIAAKMNPYNVHILNSLASAFEITAKTHNVPARHYWAKKHYLDALIISPRFDEAKLNLAAIYFNENDFENALYWTKLVNDTNRRKKTYLQIISASKKTIQN